MTALEKQIQRLGWDEETLTDHLARLEPTAPRQLAIAREQLTTLAARVTQLEMEDGKRG